MEELLTCVHVGHARRRANVRRCEGTKRDPSPHAPSRMPNVNGLAFVGNLRTKTTKKSAMPMNRMLQKNWV